MSEDPFGFAPPPFKPEDALVQIRRALRDLKLAERGSRYELRGKAVVELRAEATTITARLARKPALTPEWDVLAVKSAADQRKLVDEVRKRLGRWEHDE
jgi:DNA-binding transcriptional regulator PaaX